MIDKLPVVGKKYKTNNGGYWWHKESKVCGVYEGRVWINQCYGNNESIISLELFYKSHEELPEDKAETKPETQNLELSPEAKEAIDSLRYELRLYESAPERRNEHYSRFKAIELLNVLDKQFNKTSESVSNNKMQAEEVVDNKIEAEESIWKPVSELPTPRDNRLDNIDLFLKLDTGKIIYAQGYKNDIEPIQNTSYEKYSAYNGNFCTLTDFINDYEKLKERVKKLENNTKNNF